MIAGYAARRQTGLAEPVLMAALWLGLARAARNG